MKKIVLRQGIIAAVVIMALSGCSDEPVDVSSVTSVSDCLTQGLGNEQQCRAAWDQASQEHLREGPRFEDQNDCSEEFGQCNRYQVQNDDGSFSDVFIPLMAGMMIGNMMSSVGSSHFYHQPLYKRKDQQQYNGGFVTAVVIPSIKVLPLFRLAMHPSRLVLVPLARVVLAVADSVPLLAKVADSVLLVNPCGASAPF